MGSTIDEDLHILKQIREGVPIDCILKGLNQAEQNRLLKHQERSDSDVEDGNSLKMEFTSSDRIVNAVVYRLTRKSILMAAIDNLTTLSTSILSSAPEVSKFPFLLAIF